jgi:hypothetical protein
VCGVPAQHLVLHLYLVCGQEEPRGGEQRPADRLDLRVQQAVLGQRPLPAGPLTCLPPADDRRTANLAVQYFLPLPHGGGLGKQGSAGACVTVNCSLAFRP